VFSRNGGRRPSHTTVAAYMALFIALGGTSYAAVKLPRNSVGASQIKANGVGSSEVKNGSLRNRDFKTSDLPVGRTGAQGPAGAPGLRGAVGATGLTGPKGADGRNGTDGTDGTDGTPGTDGAPGTVGQATTMFSQAINDLPNGSNANYGAFCPNGKQAIGGGGRGDDTLSEETILTNTRPAISIGNTEPPLAGQGFMGWRITVVNPTGGATSGIKPEVWVVCVDAP
jgi:hypothetical protein